jgi:hypothetical protein
VTAHPSSSDTSVRAAVYARGMRNPARDLHELYESVPKNNPIDGISARGFTGQATESVARELRRAAEILQAIETAIAQLKGAGRFVEVYERMMPEWTSAVFSFPTGWSSTDVRPLYTRHQMDLLLALADAIDMTVNGQLGPEALKGVQDLVREAQELLKTDRSISDQLRFYLHTLLQEIQAATSDEAYLDAFNLKQALERLWVAFYGASVQSAEPAAWTKFAERIFYPGMASFLGNIGGVAVGVAQITTGGS